MPGHEKRGSRCCYFEGVQAGAVPIALAPLRLAAGNRLVSQPRRAEVLTRQPKSGSQFSSKKERGCENENENESESESESEDEKHTRHICATSGIQDGASLASSSTSLLPLYYQPRWSSFRVSPARCFAVHSWVSALREGSDRPRSESCYETWRCNNFGGIKLRRKKKKEDCVVHARCGTNRIQIAMCIFHLEVH